MWSSKMRLISVALLLAFVGGMVSASISAPPVDARQERVYRMGMPSDIRTTNTMRVLRTATVYEAYTLGMRHCSLMGLTLTQFYYVPGLAASLPEPTFDKLVKGPDGLFSQTVKIRTYWKWSDGTPVTVDDVVFSYFEAPSIMGGGDFAKGVRTLGGVWTILLDPDVLVKVEKVSADTVKLSYKKLSLRIQWAILFHDIFQKKYWEPRFRTAAAAPTDADKRARLEGLVVDDEPACGWGAFPEALKVPGKGWERGAFVTNVAVPDYSGRGHKITEFKDGFYTEEKPGVFSYKQAVDKPLTKEQGGVEKTAEYTVGPHIDTAIYRAFGTTAALVGAIVKADPDIDATLNPLGLDPGFREEYKRQPNIQIQENKSHGLFYMSFNHRRKPFGSGPLQADPKFRDDDIIGSRFRQAVNCLIDRQFTTDVLFQKVAFPVFSVVTSPAWFNPAVLKLVPCAEFTELTDAKAARAKKVDAAVKILKSVGFTWEVEPKADTATGAVSAGRGIIMPKILEITPGVRVVELKLAAGGKGEATAPAGTLAAGVRVLPSTAKVTVSLGAVDLAGKVSAPLAAGGKVSITATEAATVRVYFYGKGEKMKEFEFIFPNAAYDNRRYTFGIRTDGWMNQIGIPSRPVPTGFNVIVTLVFDEQNFDIWSLGWSLGAPAPPPDYLEAFFHSRHTDIGDDNPQGYSNPEVDALLDQFLETLDTAAQKKLAFRIQEILAVESPYVPWFDTLIIDAWRKDKVKFPLVERTQGIVGAGGMPSIVELVK